MGCPNLQVRSGDGGVKPPDGRNRDGPFRLERFLKGGQGTPLPVGVSDCGFDVQRNAQPGRGHGPGGVASIQDDGSLLPGLLQEGGRLSLKLAAQLDTQCLDPGQDQIALVEEESDHGRSGQQHCQAFAQQDQDPKSPVRPARAWLGLLGQRLRRGIRGVGRPAAVGRAWGGHSYCRF